MADSTASRSLSAPPDKENDDSLLCDNLDWRKEKNNVKKIPSRGFSPKAFYGNHRRRRGTAAELHSTIQKNALKEEKRKLNQHLECKRSAFKQVTTLRTWPLQARAMRHLNELMKIHLDQSDYGDEQSTSQYTQTTAVESSSSSSSSSAVSVEEPKRLLRDLCLSPAKSRLKVQYRNEFLSEQALKKPLSMSHTFNSPLWSMEPRIFAIEKNGSGKRKYNVGQLGRFLDLYWRKADRNARHYYELICENTPCRLYLDLEYSKVTNPDINDDEEGLLMEELFQELSSELVDQYQLEPLERSQIVDLDSSTETKFSRHWIVHLSGGALFAHTAAAGRFMQTFVSRLADLQATRQLQETRPLLQKHLFVQASKSDATKKTTCIIDLGVYTRNRLFRLLGSSKFGKPACAALRIAESNRFPFPNGFTNECFYLPAMEEHLRHNDETTTQDDLDEAIRKFAAATDWSLHAEALAQTLVVPVNASKIDFPILPYDESQVEDCAKPTTSTVGRKVLSSSSSLSFGKSPYPMIDDFVLNNLATRGGIQGSLRAYSVDYDHQGIPFQITYQMSRNRWCECIGRAHKSNNIMWTVDFKLWQCIQGCHDPECRALRFRGTPVNLSDSVREAVQDMLFEEQLARLDENELLAKSRAMEEPAKESKLDDSFDDEAFEQALLALNLDEITGIEPADSNAQVACPKGNTADATPKKGADHNEKGKAVAKEEGPRVESSTLHRAQFDEVSTALKDGAKAIVTQQTQESDVSTSTQAEYKTDTAATRTVRDEVGSAAGDQAEDAPTRNEDGTAPFVKDEEGKAISTTSEKEKDNRAGASAIVSPCKRPVARWRPAFDDSDSDSDDEAILRIARKLEERRKEQRQAQHASKS